MGIKFERGIVSVENPIQGNSRIESVKDHSPAPDVLFVACQQEYPEKTSLAVV